MITEARRIKHTVGKTLTKIESRTNREQYKTKYDQIIEFWKLEESDAYSDTYSGKCDGIDCYITLATVPTSWKWEITQ